MEGAGSHWKERKALNHPRGGSGLILEGLLSDLYKKQEALGGSKAHTVPCILAC